MKRLHRAARAALLLCTLTAAGPARAEPWFGWGQSKTEDRELTGDLDVEELLDGATVGRSRAEAREGHAGTWITLGGFFRTLEGGAADAGLLVIAGVAFDRAARRPPTRELEGAAFADPSPAMTPAVLVRSAEVVEPSSVAVTPLVARRAVAAAWRTSGLGVDDAKIDSMIARSRASAALPEARFRAMRVFLLDGTQTTVVPIDTSTYATAGATLVLEGRLTWRLDRLLYADDEGSLERLRLERQDARAKIAGRVLDALFQWQRAWLAVHTATPGTREATDATMRLIEAEAGLDVLTGGWFGAWAATLREGSPG